ncbi:hypothetical protein [Streptomyces sp. NPDC059009]|uniref:hypothetical protein n=1 Tax=Streptomyces sp. NPDC059009 TaxID=3346694 RepID=UPI0036ACD346
MSDDNSPSDDWTCELDLGQDWLDTTEDDETGAMITAEHWVGDPTSLRQFLAGPAALLTLNCYGEEGVSQPDVAEVAAMLVHRRGFVHQPEITYLDVPAGPAVRVAGPVINRSYGGLRREKGHIVTFAVAPPGKDDIIELTVAWAERRHAPELAALADSLISTLRLLPAIDEGASASQ